jgi:hypothetical protein
MPSANEYRTLPQLANEWSVGLDALRLLVRRAPALSKLGTRHGPTRVFSLREQAELRRAWDASRGTPAVEPVSQT